MTPTIISPLIAGIGPQELIIVLIVLVLLFGAKKLPELARGSGQALRIFKAETKELRDSDKDAKDSAGSSADTVPPEEREVQALNEAERARRSEPDV